MKLNEVYSEPLKYDPCLDCGFYDSDRGGCTCPSTDKWYACPLEPEPKTKDNPWA